ncbi:MAG: sialate O-acetylesterase, partial [Gemmataceae bacterium]
MKQRIWIAAALAAATLAASQGRADVKPHALFTDGMVLQRGTKCPIWGSAAPGEQVSVKFSAKKENAATESGASASADAKGKWRVEIQVGAEMAGGPYEMVIKGNNTITIKDVYVGEVWVCSGQSNMEMALKSTHNAKEAIANAKNANIRLFTVPK